MKDAKDKNVGIVKLDKVFLKPLGKGALVVPPWRCDARFCRAPWVTLSVHIFWQELKAL